MADDNRNSWVQKNIITGAFTVSRDFVMHIAGDAFIIQSPSSGMSRSVLSEPSLTWFPLEDAFEESGPNLFRLLQWDFRLVQTIHGREDDLDKILTWARNSSNTPSARLITGRGGIGKTRLVAAAAEKLRLEGWSAGFLGAANDLVDMKVESKGVFLILDYPEEQPERTAALLAKLAELATAPYPIRIVFLSRRSFAEWEPQAALLKGRFGTQELAALSPLSVEQCTALVAEAARNFSEHIRMPVPDLKGARVWLADSPLHRVPLYATAAAIHAVLSPTEAFGLAGAEVLKQLALRERARTRKTSHALGLNDEGLERLLALGVLADGLSEEAVRELQRAGVCGPSATADVITALAKSPWWKSGRVIRLEPDPVAAAFLDGALFGPSFPRGRAELPDWLFLALRENAATFGSRLGRVLYDLDLLTHENKGAHALDACLVQMLRNEPDRAVPFATVASSDVPFWGANFAAHVAIILAGKAADPEIRARFLNNAATYLWMLRRHEEALAAAKETADLYRELARGRPEAFTPNLAMSLNTLAIVRYELGRPAALAAAKEAADLYRELARGRPEAFTPELAMSLNTLANVLSVLGRPEAALAAAQEAVAIRRELARDQPESSTPDLAASLTNLANRLLELGLSEHGRPEAALTTAKEAADLYRELARGRPEAFTPNLATSLNNLANVLSVLGRPEAALAAAQEAADLYRELARGRPQAFTPDLAAALNTLANRLSEHGRPDAALAAVQEAADLYRELARGRPEAFTPDLAASLTNLANVQYQLGRLEAALTAAQEAVAIRRELARRRPEAFTSKLAASLNALAAVQWRLGLREEAYTSQVKAKRLMGQLLA